MFLNEFTLLGIGQVVLGCLVLMSALLFYLKSLRGTLFSQNDELSRLTDELKGAAAQPTAASRITAEMVARQLEITKAHHEQLGGDKPINDDINIGIPATRRAAAMRHAYLHAEHRATSDTEIPNWTTLESDLNPLMNRLIALGASVERARSLKNAEKALEQSANQAAIEETETEPDDGEASIGSSPEVDDLRLLTTRQASEIEALQAELANATDAEEKTRIINDLANKCNQLTETNHKLQLAARQLAKAKSVNVGSDAEELSRYKSQVKELETCIVTLEQEIEILNKKD